MKKIDGWEIKELKEIVKVQGGFAFKSQDFLIEGIPLVKISNIQNYRTIKTNSDVFIDSKYLKLLEDYILHNNDFVIAMSGATTGKIGKVTENFSPSFLNQRVGLFKVLDREKTDINLIYHIFSQDRITNIILGNAGSSAQPNISTRFLENIVVHFPTNKSEQTRIAEILSTVDKAIEQTEALIAKQQRIKKGLMQDLLTKGIDENGNIRSEKTHQFKDSPLGRIPVEWEVDRLENLSKISSGITLGKSYSGTGTIELPYLRVANVQDGFLDLTEITTIVLPQNQVQRYKLEIGDVLMNEGGDFDKLGRGTVWKGQIPICLHQNHVFKVRCKFEKLLPNFLEIISQSEYGKKFFLLSSKQSTNLASINSSQLKSFRIPLPKIEEQKKIIDCFDKFNWIYNNNQSFLSKLQSIKTGLMKDLLSGERRVMGMLGE